MREADARTLARRCCSTSASGGYTYTLEPGDYGRDAIDEFWLDRKLGFCEHFAAAFVVVMRALDVPARVVTGYQGADPSRWTATASCARATPTPGPSTGRPATAGCASTPPPRWRPSASSAAAACAPPPGLVAGALDTVNPALALRLRSAWEAVNNRWNQWVLNYSRGQQFDLLREPGLRARRAGRTWPRC